MKGFIILMVTCLFWIPVTEAADYNGLTPGRSSRWDANKILGQPIREVIEGRRYEYDPTAHDLKRLSLTFDKDTNHLETISLYFKELYQKKQVEGWFELAGYSKTTIDPYGNLIQYYLDDGIALHYQGPDSADPVMMVSYFDPDLFKGPVMKDGSAIVVDGPPRLNDRELFGTPSVEPQREEDDISEAAPFDWNAGNTQGPEPQAIYSDNPARLRPEDYPAYEPPNRDEPQKYSDLMARVQEPALDNSSSIKDDEGYQWGYDVGRKLSELLVGKVKEEVAATGGTTDITADDIWGAVVDPQGAVNKPAWARAGAGGSGGTLGDFKEVVQGALIYDNFNKENAGRGVLNYNGFKEWEITSGSVDLIGNGFYDSAPQNGLHVDLDGTTGKGGTMVTREAFMLQPGTYELSFDLSGNAYSHKGPNTVRVQLGEIFRESFKLKTGDKFRTIKRMIKVTRPTKARLGFQDIGNDNEGVFLDNVIMHQLSGYPASRVDRISPKQQLHDDFGVDVRQLIEMPTIPEVNVEERRAVELPPVPGEFNVEERQVIELPPVGGGYNVEERQVIEMPTYSSDYNVVEKQVQEIDNPVPNAPHKVKYQGRWMVFPSRAEKEYFERTHGLK